MAVPDGWNAKDGVIAVVRAPTAKQRLSPLEQGAVHIMPCSINHNGPAPVSNYFKPKVAPDHSLEGFEVKVVNFRGRKLLGCTSEFPEGYCGLLLEKVAGGGDATKTRKRSDAAHTVDMWNTKATFQDITYWRHDENVHSVETGHQFMDLLHLASVMHKPVSETEVVMEQKASKECGCRPKRKHEQL